jgi:hypothetical protein
MKRNVFGGTYRILLAIALLPAANPMAASDSPDAALARLSHVEHYAFGGTGFAGIISQGEKDYKLLLGRPNGLANFEKLYRQGSPEAKCYALFGIHKLDPNRFAQIVQPIRESHEEVTTMRGCIIGQEPLASIIKRIEKNEF